MSELLQWAAAIVVLVAFGLSQWGVWSVASYRYLWFNFVGGAGLSAAAALSSQWGFVVLLEGCGPWWRGAASSPVCAVGPCTYLPPDAQPARCHLYMRFGVCRSEKWRGKLASSNSGWPSRRRQSRRSRPPRSVR